MIARLTAVLMPFFNADIVNWDTSSVTDMVNVRGASSLNEDISYGIRPASRHVCGCALTHAGVDCFYYRCYDSNPGSKERTPDMVGMALRGLAVDLLGAGQSPFRSGARERSKPVCFRGRTNFRCQVGTIFKPVRCLIRRA